MKKIRVSVLGILALVVISGTAGAIPLSGFLCSLGDFFCDKPPRIIEAFLDSSKYAPGSVMVITARVADDHGIDSVTATIETDQGNRTVYLVPTNGNKKEATWIGKWTVTDVSQDKTYTTRITVTDSLGQSVTVPLEWVDPPVQYHPAEEVCPGTFGSCGVTDPEWTIPGKTCFGPGNLCLEVVNYYYDYSSGSIVKVGVSSTTTSNHIKNSILNLIPAYLTTSDPDLREQIVDAVIHDITVYYYFDDVKNNRYYAMKGGIVEATDGLSAPWIRTGKLHAGAEGLGTVNIDCNLKVRKDASIKGSLSVDGDLTVSGTKNAVVNTSLGPRRMSAVEAPRVNFVTAGSASLEDGMVEVRIDPLFLETIDTSAGYQVLLTPTAPCQVYVAEKRPDSFVVKAIGESGECSFDWFLYAVRKGYEGWYMEEP